MMLGRTRSSAAASGLGLAAKSQGQGWISAQLQQRHPDAAVTITTAGGAKVEFGKQLPFPVAKIMPNPRNDYLSMGEEALQNLAQSLKTIGCLNPIILRPIQPQDNAQPGIEAVLVCGENRWRAASMAGLEHLPSRLIKAPDPVGTDLENEIMDGENTLRRGGADRGEHRKQFIKDKYLSEISSASHGGSTQGRGGDLAQRIERETHGKIPAGTAKRYIAEIRKEIAGRQPSPTTSKDRRSKRKHAPWESAIERALKAALAGPPSLRRTVASKLRAAADRLDRK